MMRCCFLAGVLLMLVVFQAPAANAEDEKVADLIAAAKEAFRGNKHKEALALADKAVALAPKDVDVYLFRGSLRETVDDYPGAVSDLAKVVALNPKQAAGYQRLGLALFKAGKIKESIANFDKYIELRPEAKVSHWQRGISYYYAGRYDEGKEQFEGYQTFDSNDVENAVWRYLCMARKDGPAKARAAMLKTGPDKRVPMKQIYELFAGRIKPEDVLKAATAGNPPKEQLNRQLFYAHLYLGLYHETEGNRKKALEHLTKAAAEHRIGHYMWDVARVHRDLLRKEPEEKIGFIQALGESSNAWGSLSRPPRARRLALGLDGWSFPLFSLQPFLTLERAFHGGTSHADDAGEQAAVLRRRDAA
jgi:lipoprotein NlpI